MDEEEHSDLLIGGIFVGSMAALIALAYLSQSAKAASAVDFEVRGRLTCVQYEGNVGIPQPVKGAQLTIVGPFNTVMSATDLNGDFAAVVKRCSVGETKFTITMNHPDYEPFIYEVVLPAGDVPAWWSATAVIGICK